MKIEEAIQGQPEEIADKLFQMSAGFYSKLDMKNPEGSKIVLAEFKKHLSDLDEAIKDSITSKSSVEEKQRELEKWLKCMNCLLQYGDYSSLGQIGMTIEGLPLIKDLPVKTKQEIQQARQNIAPDLNRLADPNQLRRLGMQSYYQEQGQIVTIPHPQVINFSQELTKEMKKGGDQASQMTSKLEGFVQRTQERTRAMNDAITQTDDNVKKKSIERVKAEGMEDNLKEMKENLNKLSQGGQDITNQFIQVKLQKYIESHEKAKKSTIAQELISSLEQCESNEARLATLQKFIDETPKRLKHENPINWYKNKEFTLVKLASDLHKKIKFEEGKVSTQKEFVDAQEKRVAFQKELLKELEKAPPVVEQIERDQLLRSVNLPPLPDLPEPPAQNNKEDVFDFRPVNLPPLPKIPEQAAPHKGEAEDIPLAKKRSLSVGATWRQTHSHYPEADTVHGTINDEVKPTTTTKMKDQLHVIEGSRDLSTEESEELENGCVAKIRINV